MKPLSDPSANVAMIAIDPGSADVGAPTYFFVWTFQGPLRPGEFFDLKTRADAFFKALYQGDTLAESTVVRSSTQLPAGPAETGIADSKLGTQFTFTTTVYLLDKVSNGTVYVYAVAFTALKPKTNSWQSAVATSFAITV